MKPWIFFLALLFSTHVIAAEKKYAVIKSKSGREYHTGLVHKPAHLKGLGETHVILNDCDNLPDAFDLRTLGVVPDVRDQGSCGSCWAFSLTGSLESAVLAGGGQKLNLSEQELVSCDGSNWGCGGGNLNGFKYQINHGQALEENFPYRASDLRCKSGLQPVAKGVQFAYVGSSSRSPTDQELKCALYKSHTIPWITVSATGSWNSAPSDEKVIYNHCRNGGTNHAVGVVGWFQKDGKTAFIMKNSWGADWGANGYMSLPLGCDSFGEEVAFIMTDVMPCKPPIVKLPAEVMSMAGVEVMLGVREERGVEYSWTVDGVEVGKGAMLYVNATAETIYKLTGKSPCGTAESSVRLKIAPSI